MQTFLLRNFVCRNARVASNEKIRQPSRKEIVKPILLGSLLAPLPEGWDVWVQWNFRKQRARHLG